MKVVEELEKAAPLLLCKLEKIFPPGFFLSMQHLILHLPSEARMGGGPVQNCWCYPIERCLKTIRKMKRLDFHDGKSTESKCNKTVVDHITQIPVEYHIHTT